MGLNFEYTDGQTPINEDECEGLHIKTISTLQELNEFEQLNIQKAIKWTLSKNHKLEQVLTETYIKLVHKKMLGDVWDWAGTFRKSNKNLGVDWHSIGIELKQLLDDCNYWISNSSYSEIEIVIRFKHRLVCIHCFANGNGRHARLMADILLKTIAPDVTFSWANNGTLRDQTRKKYISAMKEGDKGVYQALIDFAMS